MDSRTLSYNLSAQRRCQEDAAAGLFEIATAILWLIALTVGVAGFLMPYPLPQPPPSVSPPVQASLLNVKIAAQPRPAAERPKLPVAALAEAPPLPQPLTPQPLNVAPPPPMAQLATPLPVPVESKPSFPARQSAPARSAATAVATNSPPTQIPAASAPQTLTFGEGQGDQPAPEYPREAALAHQQGTVVVRLVVGQGGRVLKAEAIDPCPYPLLNQAAVRAVREHWSRPPAPHIAAGTWDVSIEFQLRER